MKTTEYLHKGKRDIKVAFQSEERLVSVAQHDGMIAYKDRGDLRIHYFNTGRTIIQLSQQLERRRHHDNTI